MLLVATMGSSLYAFNAGDGSFATAAGDEEVSPWRSPPNHLDSLLLLGRVEDIGKLSQRSHEVAEHVVGVERIEESARQSSTLPILTFLALAMTAGI